MNKPHDNRITLETRIIAGLVILVLVLAFLILYVWPNYTDRYFSWTIVPHTTSILIGAGYLAGAYFFARVITERKWHRVQAGFPAITVFTIAMLAATILHWSRFHQGTSAFYLWTVLYVVTPFLVPFLWWRNQAGVSHELEEHDLRFSGFVRGLLGGVAVVGALACLIMFIKPTLLINGAPWKLTPLTARVFSGWSMLTFMTVLTIAYDGRWSATRILLQSAMLGQALTLIAMPRIWNDLNHTKVMAYVFIAGLSLSFIVFIFIHLWLDQASRKSLRTANMARTLLHRDSGQSTT
jgi:hypothetical protein